MAPESNASANSDRLSGEEADLPNVEVRQLKRKGKQRREEIMTVAKKHLMEHGYDNFVIHKIAAEIGIRPGNLQYYFPTRDDLLVAICLQSVNENRSMMQELTNSSISPKAKLLAVVDYLIGNWESMESYVYLVMFEVSIHNDKVRDIKRQIYEIFYSEIERVLSDVSPHFTDARRRHVAKLITTILDGLTLQYGMGPGEPRDADAEALENEVRALVLSIVES